ncbi:MAG: hypothetical protein JNL67_10145 [Planctomycetaceae bacterium]|nr:hypothetical protein [Planctomycetaceae bacterium]
MPRLTIIVPLMDQVDAFETTLASVLRYAGTQIEVMAAISGGYADQYGILNEINSVEIDARRTKTALGRVAMAAGSANSAWVYWLTPGVELTQEALDAAVSIIQRRDLGLASPRIVAQSSSNQTIASQGRPAGLPGCSLASSVVLTNRFHPMCLEELIGEQWSMNDLTAQIRVVGPTGWAGLVQRRLLTQWLRTGDAQLPSGYAELSLGLFVQQDGWAHDWIEGELIASEAIATEIEAGYRLCGRASNQILSITALESRKSPIWPAVRASMSELAGGCLSPQLLRVVWERFQSWRSLRKASLRRPLATTASDSEVDHEDSATASNSETSSRSSSTRSKQFRSAA